MSIRVVLPKFTVDLSMMIIGSLLQKFLDEVICKSAFGIAPFTVKGNVKLSVHPAAVVILLDTW